MCLEWDEMAQVVEDPIAAAHAAAGRRDWKEAYDLLSTAGDSLSVADIELLADAAFWSVRLDESLALRERAYKAHLDEGDNLRAGGIAVRLAMDYLTKGQSALFNGWQARGERLLADQPESREHGQAALVRAIAAQWSGKLDESLAQGEHAYELGKRFGDPDLQALGLVAQGSALVYLGELDRGLALLDEASTSALTGELDPFSSTVVYCVTISSSQGIGDFERARQWTEAANKWCDVENTHGFPGACRVHRSEILWLGGQWEAAEREAVNACAELESYNVVTTAAGYYQIGEIHRRRGDFMKAEEAYAKAFKLGREPQPGQALLRVAQGKVDAAALAIRRSLGAEDRDPVTRARRLPAQIDVSLAIGDVESAKAAAEELDGLTDRFRVNGERTPLLEGSLQISLARIAAAEGDWAASEAAARKGLAIWTRVDAPYEKAEARVSLGMAYERQGDVEGARAEYEAAKEAFERLGAVLDAERTRELLREEAATRTFVFTDMVSSTTHLVELGEEKWNELLDRHDELLTTSIRGHGGTVIKHTGDGFFAAFTTPAAAAVAAVEIQQTIADEPFQVRIGLHSGEALKRGSDYTGRGVNVAARIGALASGGEVLVSTDTLDGVETPYGLSSQRSAELKGFDEPVPIAALCWQ
jgi:class 3 adenylate cyclase